MYLKGCVCMTCEICESPDLMPSRASIYQNGLVYHGRFQFIAVKLQSYRNLQKYCLSALFLGFYPALTVVSYICSCIVYNIWSMSSSLGEAFEKQVAFSVAMMLIFHQGTWDNSRTSLADLPFSLTSLTIEVQHTDGCFSVLTRFVLYGMLHNLYV